MSKNYQNSSHTEIYRITIEIIIYRIILNILNYQIVLNSEMVDGRQSCTSVAWDNKAPNALVAKSPWTIEFWSRYLKTQRYDLSEAPQTKPFFKLNNGVGHVWVRYWLIVRLY